MAERRLTPIGYVDEDGRYYAYEQVHMNASDIDYDAALAAPRWLFDWALKEVNEAAKQ